MKRWTAFERRWRDALLAAVAPAEDGWPGYADVPGGEVWDALDAKAPPMLRLGLRAATWILTIIAPLLWLGRPRLFVSLDADARDRLVRRLAASDRYLVRQMVLVLKLVACFVLLRDPGLRRRIDPVLVSP